jgi:hypothetical protein
MSCRVYCSHYICIYTNFDLYINKIISIVSANVGGMWQQMHSPHGVWQEWHDIVKLSYVWQ